MIPAIIYPVPMDNWSTFKTDVERFAATFQQFELGCDAILFLMVPPCEDDQLKAEVSSLFDGINYQLRPYSGRGADIGAHQCASFQLDDRPMVCLSSRVHFHRAGWLKRLMDCWNDFGPGLYGTAATREPGRLCLRTHCYMLGSYDFQRYPHVINSRSRGHFFEWGDHNPDGSLTDWYQSLGGMTRVVYWDSCSDVEWLAQDNIFRRGDQSNLLVWDRHTELWKNSSEHEKAVLATMAFGMDTRPNGV